MRFRFLSALAILLSSAALLSAADASMVDLIMPDAKILIGVDFDRARNSPFGQFALRQLPGGGGGANAEAGLDKLSELTGFDPRRDLHEILIATTDTVVRPGKAVDPAQNAVVIVRGAFNPAKLTELAGNRVQMSSYNGVSIMEVPASVSRRGRAAAGAAPAAAEANWVGFMGNLAIAGTKTAVQKTIDRGRAARKADSAAMLARVQSAGAKHDVWFLTTVSPTALAGNIGNANMQGALKGDLMQGIESMTGGIKFGANVVLSGEATARSDQDASALVDVLRFFASMAQSNGAKSGPMGMLNDLQMNAAGRTVKFSLTAPAAEFEKLLGSGLDRARPRAALD
ncbi:MAG: hypothetical protein IT162_04940 [Bryobacterales bacterium]|nr:hypothetical protein [Bryobacterales bacterium]